MALLLERGGKIVRVALRATSRRIRMQNDQRNLQFIPPRPALPTPPQFTLSLVFVSSFVAFAPS